MTQHSLSYVIKRRGPKGLIQSLGKAFRRELSTDVTLPLSQRVRLWRFGFKSTSYFVYDFSRNDPSDYLSDVALSITSVNGSFRRILDDKLLFHTSLSNTLPIPELLGVIESGTISNWAGSPIHDFESLLAFCSDATGLVLKPARSSRGQGILVVRCCANGCYTLNGRDVDVGDIKSLCESLDDYLVTAFIEQADYAAQIFPHSSNSIRFIAMNDSECEPLSPIAVHRFGTHNTVPVDNWCRGGLCALIDPQTGRLGPAVANPIRTGGQLEWHSKHPDTDAPIEGVVVPNWPIIQQSVLAAMASVPVLRYVGWDILIANERFWVLEGNADTDIDLLQVHKPLLSIPAAREFYKRHNVI